MSSLFGGFTAVLCYKYGHTGETLLGSAQKKSSTKEFQALQPVIPLYQGGNIDVFMLMHVAGGINERSWIHMHICRAMTSLALQKPKT